MLITVTLEGALSTLLIELFQLGTLSLTMSTFTRTANAGVVNSGVN
jgi:hypothetical protein